MSTGVPLPDDEFIAAVLGFEHTAFRLELQPSYAVAYEDPLFAAFLRGEPGSPLDVPDLAQWYECVAWHVGSGREVARVRVQEDPPTDYQRFERWLDAWNIRAGEVMRYMTSQQARDAGLLPAAGHDDWWLLDSSRLIVMKFGTDGHRVRTEIVTDPAEVARACEWADLAVRHSTIAQTPAA